MTHGAPDDSNILRNDTMQTLVDVGEAAVRLGAPVIFYRSGDVIYTQDFNGIGGDVVLEATGSNSYARLSNARFVTAGVGVELAAMQVGSSDASMTLFVGPLITRYVGVSLCLWVGTLVGTVDLEVTVRRADISYYPHIRLDIVNGKIQYKSEVATWTDAVTGLSFPITTNVPVWVKLLFDAEAWEFVSFAIGNDEYSMKNIPIYSAVGVGYEYSIVKVVVTPKAGAICVAYLDAVTVTQHDE